MLHPSLLLVQLVHGLVVRHQHLLQLLLLDLVLTLGGNELLRQRFEPLLEPVVLLLLILVRSRLVLVELVELVLLDLLQELSQRAGLHQRVATCEENLYCDARINKTRV